MIKNELMEEIIYKSKNNEYIDKELIKKITYDEIEQSSGIIKSKFKDIKFVKIRDKSVFAEAFKYDGVIHYDYEKIIKLSPNDKDTFKINLRLIHCLLHELEHIKELKKINDNNFDSELLKLVSVDFLYNLLYGTLSEKYKNDKKIKKVFLKIYSDLGSKNWSILPTERIAELDSYKLLIESINAYPNFNELYKNVYVSVFCGYFNKLKLGYYYNSKKNRYNAPLEDYFKVLRNFGGSITLEDLGIPKTEYSEKVKKLSLERKMRYGFYITKEEMKKVDEQKKLIKSTI